MDQLIEIIFSNPLFLVLIFIVINFLLSQNKGNEEEQEQKPKRRHAERQRQSVPPKRPIEKRQVEQDNRYPHIEIEEQLSADQLRKQQLERLTAEIQGDIKEDQQEEERRMTQHVQSTTDKQQSTIKKKKVKSNIKERLTSKGLIDSVIMAEVLGPPRAVKRYENRQMNHRH